MKKHAAAAVLIIKASHDITISASNTYNYHRRIESE